MDWIGDGTGEEALDHAYRADGGHPAAFLVVLVYAVLWLTFSPPTFEWNAVATLAVFAMTPFIQRAKRRDNLVLHAKLDELLRVDGDALGRS